MAISSYKVELHSAAVGGASPTYTKLIDIKDFPDMIGDPNMLETTTLSDGQQTYIAGIKSADMLTFTANYTKEDWEKCKALEGKSTAYKLKFGDGSEFTWTGQLSLGLPGKGVDEVLEMTLNIAPSTAVEFGTTAEA